jgi:hypothetical protein
VELYKLQKRVFLALAALPTDKQGNKHDHCTMIRAEVAQIYSLNSGQDRPILSRKDLQKE